MIRFRPLLGPTLWFIPGVILLAGLGFWQIQRMHEKEALLASIASGMSAPPVPLPEAIKGGIPQAEWRHVQVHGQFLHDDESYIFALAQSGAVGVHVVTPLMRDGESTVLIDRGFVPEALHDPKTRAQGQLEGDVSVTGVLRLPQAPGLFTPAPDLKTRLFFVKDTAAIAEAAQVATLPFIIEADATPNPGGWPQGGQTRIDIPNDHLQYAITWFGLAITLTVIYLLYHSKLGRLSFGR